MQSCETQSQWIHLQNNSCAYSSENIAEDMAEKQNKTEEPLDMGVCSETISPSDVSKYGHKFSTT